MSMASAAPAQTVRELLDTMSGTARYTDVSLSPDGRFVTWSVQPPSGRGTGSSIWLLDLTKPGASAARVTSAAAAAHQEAAVAWSPDGRQFAFLSDAESAGQLQLYVASPGGTARKVTSLTGFLSAPRWSPDGSKIALLFTENAPRAAGPLVPSTKPSGAIEEKIYEQRLTLVDPKSGDAKPITPPDTYVYEYDWAPDSSRLAYTAAKGNGDNNWWVARLYTVAAASGEIAEIYKPPLQIAVPRFSPDGGQIAFIGGLMSDEGSTGGDIYTVPASAGSPARDITAARHSSPSWIDWLPSGKILFTETIDGGTGIAAIDPASNAIETLWKGDESLRAGDASIAASNDGKTIASMRSSWTMAPSVWAGRVGEWKQLTHENDNLKPLWGKTENVQWESDGFHVEGWMMYPLNYDPSKKYPMVVSVHGGPAAAKRPSWPSGFDLTALSSQGYFVFFPNPRGSFGEGEGFTRANVKDFGYGDLRDVLLGVDHEVKALPIDPNRMGISGWSYGGYMTMWTVTQTRRFHAAVAGAGISDWQSYYGENLIDQWMIPYFGASVYDNPAVYAKSSPITYIKNVKTPTLILVGDSDAECPAPQSFEFWHALKTLGVKTELVVYPDEGHSFRKRADVQDLLERTIGWFNENLQAQ